MSNNNPSVAIIILNFRTWEKSIACLDSLRALQTICKTCLIICDNASNNQSFKHLANWVTANYPSEGYQIYNDKNLITKQNMDCVLIQTGANLGFAAGMNAGINYALMQDKFEYIWLLNNDVIITQNSLDELYNCAKLTQNNAIIGSTILDMQPPHLVQCAAGCTYNAWLSKINCQYAGYASLNNLPEPKLDYIYGAALFIPSKIINQVGLLNEEYFLFYEELDYCTRAINLGYKLHWCPKSIIYHHGSATIGKNQLAHYYENLSTLKYTANFYPQRLLIVIIIRLLAKITLLIWRRELNLFPSLYRAYRDFLLAKFWR
jgi:GT2 family glycosyltransferase